MENKSSLTPIGILIVSLVLAPVTILLGFFLVAISAHNGGILTVLGMCLAPGMLILNFVPDTPYEIQIGIVGQFILFWVLGQLYLRCGHQWRSWWQSKQEEWFGQKWEKWFKEK